jgi:hypothetical protein
VTVQPAELDGVAFAPDVAFVPDVAGAGVPEAVLADGVSLGAVPIPEVDSPHAPSSVTQHATTRPAARTTVP